MKKFMIMGLLSVSTLAMFASTADAQTKEDKTDVGVSFKSDGANDNGENKPFKNNLSLVWKPTAFTFGEQKAVGGVATYNNTIKDNQYLIVNDDRTDATAGSQWLLSAKLSDMVASDETKLTSNITFNLGDAQKYTIGTAIDPDTNDYIPAVPDASSLSSLDSTAGITIGDNQVKAVSLEAGATAPVALMSKKTKNTVTGGVATQISDTKLVVKDSKNAAGKSFKGSVTWTLDDAPVFN